MADDATPPGYGYPPYGAPQPPPYNAPPYGWQPPPYGYQYGGYGSGGYGPPGQIRKTGTTILLVIVTLGIYIFIYNYKVHDEMKRYGGRGVGGGIALLLTFIANIAMPFITPMEVGQLYLHRGERPPVSGWTGLWYVVPGFVGQFFFFISIIVVGFSTTSGVSSTGSQPFQTTTAVGGVVLGIAVLLVYFGLILGGTIFWFAKTNGALNRYWESVGVPPR